MRKIRNKVKVISIHNPKEIINLKTEQKKEGKEKIMNDISIKNQTKNPKAQNPKKGKNTNKTRLDKIIKVISIHNPRDITNIDNTNSHTSEKETKKEIEEKRNKNKTRVKSKHSPQEIVDIEEVKEEEI